MELVDGEYDLDVSMFHDMMEDTEPLGGDNLGNRDNRQEIESLAIRYGQISESINHSPMKVYQDKKNLILQGKGESKDIILEGINQLHNVSAMGNYYLKFNDNNVKLMRLNNTIKFNKSRNPEKWQNMIRTWDLKLQGPSMTSPKLPEAPHEVAPRQDEIISEADFDDIDFKMEFDDHDIQFDDKEVNDQEIMKQKKLDHIRQVEKEKQRKFEEKRQEQERMEREARERERQEIERLQQQKQQQLQQQQKYRQQQRQAQPLTQPPPPQEEPPRTRSRSGSIGTVALIPPSHAKISSKHPSKSVPKRPTKASKSVSSSLEANKAITSETNDMDDEFDDLEDQLDEILEDSSDNDTVLNPITIFDEPVKKPTEFNQGNYSKPMSLKEFYGETDDISSEEE